MRFPIYQSPRSLLVGVTNWISKQILKGRDMKKKFAGKYLQYWYDWQKLKDDNYWNLVVAYHQTYRYSSWKPITSGHMCLRFRLAYIFGVYGLDIYGYEKKWKLLFF